MSINKAFVVKNSFEVSTDLILADADTRKVGIASTNPQFTLDVAGGIGATDFYLTGIGTFVDELNVGLGGTVLTVLGLGNSVGIGTALPAYLLDIRSPISTGQTALYVQGDIEITGDIRADDIFIDDAEIEDLIVTDTLFVVGISTFSSNVFVDADLNVSGITTLGNYVDITDDLNVAGIATIATLSAVDAELSNLNVTGIATIATISVVGAALSNLNVTGIATLGVINTTNLTLQNLEVSGITTLGAVEINSGIITAKSGIVTYFGDGSGLVNTPPGSPAGSNTQVQYNNNGAFAGSSNFTFDGNNVNISGIVTASAFFGDGSGLTGAGSTVFNDTTTDQEFFPLFTDITTGTITSSGISTSKLTYNPFTGTLTAVDLNATSDINLKENIHTVENALETVSSLRGVSFDWKENGKSSYGVIAQELEDILPELVKNGEVKSVNYNGIIGVLIEAIKELKEEIKIIKSYK